MLDGLFMLLTLSVIMAVASFLAGSLPLSFSLSQSRLRLISTIGMGVLVGTSLIVIIPEGVETLYTAGESSVHMHDDRNIFYRSGTIYPKLNSRNPTIQDFENEGMPRKGWYPRRDEALDANPIDNISTPVLPENDGASADSEEPPQTPTSPDEDRILDSASSTPSASSPSIPISERTPHVWIGLSLILGFILMYLLDTLPQLSAPSKSRPQQANIYSLSDLSSSPVPPPPQRAFSTTLGLCIHAAADGIALGASSSSTSTTSLSLIIFVAVMVHKAPAAFGLTSVLLKQGLGKRGARAHLVVFSIAAPIGAIGTWVIVRTLGGGSGGEEETMKWWTGVLLLFSGGTFLYVAMHTMQENENSSSSVTIDDPPSNGYLDGSPHHSRDMHHRPPREGRSLKLVLAAIAGMLLPLITQIGHAH